MEAPACGIGARPAFVSNLGNTVVSYCPRPVVPGGRTTGRPGCRLLRRPCRSRVLTKAVAAPEKIEVPPFQAWNEDTGSGQKRTDIKTIMLLGAGPIVIGQVGPADTAFFLLYMCVERF
jgi:hypothetical protein